MGKKRARHPVEEDEAKVLEDQEEFERELEAAREIMREQMELEGDGEDDEDNEEEEDAMGGDLKNPKPREFMNNQKGLKQALEEVSARNATRPWPETLDICQFPLDLEDVHDDIKRETAFYQNALAAVKESRTLLAKHNVPYKRPEDFFCDMLKSDQHMARIKDRLLFEQKKIAAVEGRRKQQENRKFSKALKTHKVKEKNEDKKRTLDAVKQWKKDKAQRGGGQGLLPDDDGLDDVLEGRGGGGGRGDGGGGGRETGRGTPPNKGRVAKDRKYGFGGPKRKLKQSDSKSLNDFTAFHPKKGKAAGGGRGGRGGGGGGGKGKGKKGSDASRPGKTARVKMRMKKRG